MEYYPIVLIPNNILESIKKEIPKNLIYKHLGIDMPEYKYVEPKKIPEYLYITQRKIKIEDPKGMFGCLGILLILASIWYSSFLIAFIRFSVSFPFEVLIPIPVLFLLVMIVAKVRLKKVDVEVPIGDQRYQKQKEELIKEIESHNWFRDLELDSFRNKIISIDNNIRHKIDDVKKEIYYKDVKPKSFYKRISGNVKRGKTELFFLELLIKRFGSQVKVDIAPNAYQNYYFPDFVFECAKSGLHIDIEIDEPYSLKEKEPIHYIGSKDEGRNRYFLDQNWVVIRFSENQIINNTQGCLNLIDKVVNAILQKRVPENNNLPPEKRWTYEEALLMASRDTRSFF